MPTIETGATAPRQTHPCRTGPARPSAASGEIRDKVVLVMEPDAACAAKLAALLDANGFAPRVHASFGSAWEAIHRAPAPHAIIAASDRHDREPGRSGGLTLLDCFRTTRKAALTRLILVTDDPYLEMTYQEDRGVLTVRKPLIPAVILAFLEADADVS